jgi:hypothetical protein
VLGVHGKLVKYVVHSSKRKIEKNKKFFTQAAQTAIDQFLVSRNFRGYYVNINITNTISRKDYFQKTKYIIGTF